MKNRSVFSLLTLFACLACCRLSGCAWVQSHPATTTALETDLVKVGASIAQVAASNGTLSYAQAIPLGLSSITDVVAGMNTDAASAKIGATVNQFSAWTLPAAQVAAITQAYAAANPQTPAAQKAFLIAAAGDLSKGLNPAPTTPAPAAK